MQRSAAYLLLAGLVAGAAFTRLGSAEAAARPTLQQGAPVVVAAARTPFWDTMTIKDDTPTMVLKVPAGQRFVLTDVWLLSMEDAHTPADISDRFWLENRRAGESFIVFDSLLGELSLPLTWRTGVAFSEETEIWMNWNFGTAKRRLRRVHYTGYYEDLVAPAVSR